MQFLDDILVIARSLGYMRNSSHGNSFRAHTVKTQEKPSFPKFSDLGALQPTKRITFHFSQLRNFARSQGFAHERKQTEELIRCELLEFYESVN